MGEGFHGYDLLDTLTEAPWSAFIHHFPFREPEVTRRRMAALCDAGETGTSPDRAAGSPADPPRSERAATHRSASRVRRCVRRPLGRGRARAAGRHAYELVLADWAQEWDVGLWY